MKVLHAINRLRIGGAEKLLVNSLPFFLSKGIKIDVLTLTSEQSFLSNDLKKNHIDYFSLKSKSLYNPLIIFKLLPYLRSYDIIHVHLFPSCYFFAIAKMLTRAKTKLVYTEHSPLNRRRNKFFRIIDRFIFKNYHTIVSISFDTDTQIQSHLKLNAKKFKVIYNGINLNEFKNITPNEQIFPIQQSDKYVIQISSFHYPKDQITLIKAISLLPENVKLLLVGQGRLLEQTKEFVSSIKLENRVFFLGLRRDIPELLALADIVVLSSFYEGFGMAIVEGMASAKPCVVSDVSGLSEILNGYGLLFKPGDYFALSKILSNLIEDKSYCDKIGEKCLERSKEFDINKMVNQYASLYQSIHTD